MQYWQHQQVRRKKEFGKDIEESDSWLRGIVVRQFLIYLILIVELLIQRFCFCMISFVLYWVEDGVSNKIISGCCGWAAFYRTVIVMILANPHLI